jgi:hypothetical protein
VYSEDGQTTPNIVLCGFTVTILPLHQVLSPLSFTLKIPSCHQQEITRSILVQFVPIWSNLVQLGPIWSNLVQFDPNMVCCDTIWSNFDHFGQHWTTLDHIGPLWTSFDNFGPLWTTLDHFGPLWTTLDHFFKSCLHSSKVKAELNQIRQGT